MPSPPKPCPIDGGAAEWRQHPIRGTGSSGMEAPDLSIRCTVCGLETTRERTEKWEQGRGTYSIREQAEAKLLARWDTRPESEVASVMREALKPFADCVEQIADDEDDEEWAKFRLLIKDYRRAAKAMQATARVE